MITARAAELVGKLEAEGVRATYDAREAANPPVILVAPPTITPVNRCGAEYVWPLYCLAPMPADADTLGVLEPLLEACWAAGLTGPVRPVTYSSAAGELASLLVTYTETI